MIQLHPNRYNDETERDAVQKYLKAKGTENNESDIRVNDKYSSIDLRWFYKGKFWAVEVAKTKLWPFGAQPFNGSHFDAPLRKWKHMWEALHQEGVCVYDLGIYCILSNDLTHIVIFNMRDLLKIDIEKSDNMYSRTIFGETIVMVKIPISLVKKYEKL